MWLPGLDISPEDCCILVVYLLIYTNARHDLLEKVINPAKTGYV